MTRKMTKKYKLKPGLHQFAPGSPASFTNDNLTDEEVEWYLEKYPHIRALVEENPDGQKTESRKDAVVIVKIEEQPSTIDQMTESVQSLKNQCNQKK